MTPKRRSSDGNPSIRNVGNILISVRSFDQTKRKTWNLSLGNVNNILVIINWKQESMQDTIYLHKKPKIY